jgi:hypothetical protein
MRGHHKHTLGGYAEAEQRFRNQNGARIQLKPKGDGAGISHEKNAKDVETQPSVVS